ncbi:MAG TPA: ABC transporter permease [Dinghuibacter sp.]|uniref:ABC transporter permease n=1 Tax=Dinghuibacter sp. TaxID=2024697 RepID=UPI002B5B08D6|nr:ABC transporter permease [Dinghuibacter sp.]HTJ13628.1 ABC transporter permease [Dinghuibacter sp.]
MLKSYLSIAWRNILRTKWYSALNIAGLALGMSVALLIGLWVYYQYSWDRFLPNYNEVYHVARNFDNNGEILTFNSVSLKLASTLKNQVPEMEVAETDGFGFHGLKAGETRLGLSGGQVNDNFLDIFGFPLVKGDPNHILKDPFSIVLTESTAKALFGHDDPIGKTVTIDNQHDVKVTGILKDLPPNCSFDFKYLLPFSYLAATDSFTKRAYAGSYNNNGYEIYVRLRKDASLKATLDRIGPIEHTEKYSINAMKSMVILQPMREWQLWGDYKNGKPAGGMIDYVRMFAIIGILVLAIACINFVNLETARSERRAKEVGVRKAIGSRRKDLILQFMTESFLLTTIAFVATIVLTVALLPAFNMLAQTEISLPLTNPLFWITVLAATAVVALVSGSRPALYLSSFQPVAVLKGLYKAGANAPLGRKVLVVIQFTCSIALIVSTIIIYQQIRHTQERPMGYDPNRLLTTRMNADLARNFNAIRNDLVKDHVIDNMATSTSPATGIWWHSDVDQFPGKQPGETVEMGMIGATDDYLKTMGCSLAAGRGFDGPADSLSVVLNEAAVRRLRLTGTVVGSVITTQGNKVRIIGIAKNALMISPFKAADPTLFFQEKPTNCNFLLYRLSPRITTEEAVKRLTEVFDKYEPSFPYEFNFVDQQYARKFDLEVLIGRLSGILAGLAIVISCMGLFGLAAYMAEQRTKEIGIRKVLGASVPQVWLLLSKDFILLVLISCIVAAAPAFYFLEQWLQKYDYRITINPLVFFAAGAVALVITLITTSFQSIRAALANPTKCLRAE